MPDPSSATLVRKAVQPAAAAAPAAGPAMGRRRGGAGAGAARMPGESPPALRVHCDYCDYFMPCMHSSDSTCAGRAEKPVPCLLSHITPLPCPSCCLAAARPQRRVRFYLPSYDETAGDEDESDSGEETAAAAAAGKGRGGGKHRAAVRASSAGKDDSGQRWDPGRGDGGCLSGRGRLHMTAALRHPVCPTSSTFANPSSCLCLCQAALTTNCRTRMRERRMTVIAAVATWWMRGQRGWSVSASTAGRGGRAAEAGAWTHIQVGQVGEMAQNFCSMFCRMQSL